VHLKWSKSFGFFAVLMTLCAGPQAADSPPELLQLPQPNPPESVAFPAVPEPGKTQTATLFPRYEPLMPAVSFWTRVFSEFSEQESVIHSTAYPHKILRVLDFRAQAARMSEGQLAKYRRKAESDAKDQMEDLIAKINRKRSHPESMNAEERRVYALFKDVKDDQLFATLRGTIRSQRGLRERTEKALRVSDRYLPYMEKVFHGYKMPAELTRLPLVESSFNLDAYSKAGAAGIWQFIPSSARIYMRLNEVVDDRRDPWTSTDAAARHLRDDYALLGDWPLAITAYNHGRGGISRGLKKVQGKTLIDLIERYDSKRFGFAGKNYYAEFLAAVDVERAARQKQTQDALEPLQFEVVETQHYVPYETLRRLCGADDELFRRLNPAYRPEVISGKLYVPPGHLIRIPAGSARSFEVAYARLGDHERFEKQRVFYLLHKVRRGDTLGKLARDYRTSTKQIQNANGLRSTNIRIGQVLKIPPHEEARPGPITVAVGESKPSLTRKERQDALRESAGPAVYIVRSGDTLGEIAERYGTSVAVLRNSNGLRSSTIRVGQRLSVPGRGVGKASTHTVRSGETLISIAADYHVDVDDLQRANKLGQSSLIKVGQTLQLPGGSTAITQTHTVRSGQTLSSIARSYDVSVADLRGANNLGKSSLIRVGQTLQVPAR
jgi:membrane-bound lytic murein transglycosylase D